MICFIYVATNVKNTFCLDMDIYVGYDKCVHIILNVCCQVW